MSFKDVIKNSVLEGFNTADLSTASIIVTLIMAVVIGVFIYFIYRFNTRSGFYNRGLNKSLATIPLITAGIMLAMQSNLVISLGMVGALSIVRFRNAVKEPVDLTFLFWSISSGIIVGAGLFELVVILGLCIAAFFSMLDLLPNLKAPYLLVISGNNETSEQEILCQLKGYCSKVKIRSRNITKHGKEWILELQTKKGDLIVDDIAKVKGVSSVNLMSHDGELRC